MITATVNPCRRAPGGQDRRRRVEHLLLREVGAAHGGRRSPRRSSRSTVTAPASRSRTGHRLPDTPAVASPRRPIRCPARRRGRQQRPPSRGESIDVLPGVTVHENQTSSSSPGVITKGAGTGRDERTSPVPAGARDLRRSGMLDDDLREAMFSIMRATHRPPRVLRRGGPPRRWARSRARLRGGAGPPPRCPCHDLHGMEPARHRGARSRRRHAVEPHVADGGHRRGPALPHGRVLPQRAPAARRAAPSAAQVQVTPRLHRDVDED